MVSTQSSLRRETPLEDSHPHSAAMIDIDTLQQLQTRMVEMERRNKEELRKLKVAHDQLEASVKHPQGEKHFAYTLLECTQRESHPRRTINTVDDLSLSHIHPPTRQTTCRHPFVDCILELDIPLGWKPLNLE